MNNKMEAARAQYRELVASMCDAYRSALASAANALDQGARTVVESAPYRTARGVANEIYQQVAWALRYWNTEENLEKAAVQVVALLKDLAMDQVRDTFRFTDKMAFLLYLNKVTLYEPT